MKKILAVALVAAVAVAMTGCQKEESPVADAAAALKSDADKAAKDAGKVADAAKKEAAKAVDAAKKEADKATK